MYQTEMHTHAATVSIACEYQGKKLTGVAVQFGTQYQKNAIKVQDVQQFLTLKYAIMYFSYQFLQSGNYLLCKF